MTAIADAIVHAQSTSRPAEPPSPVAHDPAKRFAPFPLTEMQQAYWLASGSPELGGRSAHFYLEIDFFSVSVEDVENAFNELVARHDMLRAALRRDGRQQVSAQVPRYRIAFADLVGATADEAEERLAATRDELSGQVFDPYVWPLYDVRAHALGDGRLRLHLSIDLLPADAGSIQILLSEWIRLILDPDTVAPALELTFRDVVEAAAAHRAGPAYERAREYWRERVPVLPASPQLPVRPLSTDGPPRFVRRRAQLPEHAWLSLRERARAANVTPSMLLCAAYAEVLRVWSSAAHFTLNLTLAERPAWHPDTARMIGDFTSNILLECDLTGGPALADTAAALQSRLREDLAHAAFSGVAVQRELARRAGGASARMPVVFTSLLRELDGVAALEGVVFETGYAVSQTPQVILDNQVVAQGGGLVISWDAVDAVFPEGMLDDMFDAYIGLLRRTIEDDSVLRRPAPVTAPPVQLARRAAANNTVGPLPTELIHAGIDRQAALRADAPAVITRDRTLSFGELDLRASQVAHRLRELAAGPLVGIVMHKGWEQVVAALGIVRAGAAYLPVDAGLPPGRIAQLLAAAKVSTVLTQPRVPAPAGVRAIVVEPRSWPQMPDRPVRDDAATTPDDLAYVIFTSGSTGRPKGVMISHRSAVNTLTDINERLSAGPGDRVLGVSSASFDLSVYDVFGVLGAGGAIVLPGPDDVRDPARLADLATRHRVTLWNTVPMLLELLVEHCERQRVAFPAALRAILLSGDWIPLSLPGRVAAIAGAGPALFSLGGATEATIWSIWHPITGVDPKWRSIPYGTPLRNQTFHVLDDALEPKPDLVPGELYIGGAGLAQGYLDDPELTAARFPTHPRTGERLYRTGDLGRYLPDGAIEFLGRQDTQVKVGGHRIELGEIEAVLAAHSSVRAAVVTAPGTATGPKRLVAFVVPAPSAVLEPAQLSAFLAERLPAYMVPPTISLLDSLPLGANGKVDRAALPLEVDARRSAELPATPAERAMARIWTDLLGVSEIGRHDDFFALGGDSLLGVRAVAKAAEHGLYLTAGEFYSHPTIAQQVRAARAEPPAAEPEQAPHGPVGLSPSQHWFFGRGLAHPNHWNGMWPVFELDAPLNPDHLSAALLLVVDHHDALRTRFRSGPDGWRADIAAPGATVPPVEVVGLAEVADPDLEDAISSHVAARNGSLNLADGPVVRLTYFDLGPGRAHRLLISAHWLVMDYYSSRVFYEDLRATYSALADGRAPQLPARTASLRRCLDQLGEYATSDELAAQLPHWRRIANSPATPLPVDHHRGPNTQRSATWHLSQITGEAAQAIVERLPRAHGMDLRDVLIAALVRTVAAWTGRHEVLLELEGHGREHAYGPLDVSRTVARLSTLSPARIRTGGFPEIRDQLAAIPHRGVGFGVLRHLHPDPAIRDQLAAAPTPEVGFNFWGEVSEYFTDDSRPMVDSFGHHRSEHDERPRVMDLTALTVAGDLWLVWGYSENLHTAETMATLCARFVADLTEEAR